MKCEVWYSLKLVKTPKYSHWPYQGGNTYVGEIIKKRISRQTQTVVFLMSNASGCLKCFVLFCVFVYVRAILSWWTDTWHILHIHSLNNSSIYILFVMYLKHFIFNMLMIVTKTFVSYWQTFFTTVLLKKNNIEHLVAKFLTP